MALRFAMEFVLDVDEWDEAVPLTDYLRTVLETESGRAGRVAEHNRGCDLYGVYPIYRADGEHIGHWEMWNVDEAGMAEVLGR